MARHDDCPTLGNIAEKNLSTAIGALAVPFEDFFLPIAAELDFKKKFLQNLNSGLFSVAERIAQQTSVSLGSDSDLPSAVATPEAFTFELPEEGGEG